jgi:hypothetical protein
LQRAVFQLPNILKNYNMKISEEKTKSVAVAGKIPQRAKILIRTKWLNKGRILYT